MKPKIKIGEPTIYKNAVVVPYEFDSGEKGYRNFTPQQFLSLDIEEIILKHYEACQQAKQVNIKELIEKKIKETAKEIL